MRDLNENNNIVNRGKLIVVKYSITVIKLRELDSKNSYIFETHKRTRSGYYSIRRTMV